MGKDKKKPNIGIKTTRYFTKNCIKCNAEYPNWFTNCPQCGAAWDDVEKKKDKLSADESKKNVKIVVKITEDDFNQAISNVQLVFSANHGKSWFQMPMIFNIDYYLTEITDVPVGSVIIYYIEVHLANGEKIVENNEEKYFYYNVGGTNAQLKEDPPQEEAKAIQENIKKSSAPPINYLKSSEKKTQNIAGATIFGKRQTQFDPDLKTCRQCKSKIKKMWSICPICGKIP